MGHCHTRNNWSSNANENYMSTVWYTFIAGKGGEVTSVQHARGKWPSRVAPIVLSGPWSTAWPRRTAWTRFGLLHYLVTRSALTRTVQSWHCGTRKWTTTIFSAPPPSFPPTLPPPSLPPFLPSSLLPSLPLFLSPSSHPSYTRIFTALHVTVKLHIFAVSHARTPSCGWTKSGWAIPGDLILHRFPWSYCIVMITSKRKHCDTKVDASDCIRNTNISIFFQSGCIYYKKRITYTHTRAEILNGAVFFHLFFLHVPESWLPLPHVFVSSSECLNYLLTLLRSLNAVIVLTLNTSLKWIILYLIFIFYLPFNIDCFEFLHIRILYVIMSEEEYK